jgi:hypothetical protein
MDECMNVPHCKLQLRVSPLVICALGCRQSERAAHGAAGHLGGAGELPVQQHSMRHIAAHVSRIAAARGNCAWHFRPAPQWR